MTPTPEQIEKLPRWAQEHIKDLDRRMVVAERAVAEYKDSQTPSEFYYEDHLCIGGGSPQLIRRYIQTNRMTIEHAGVQVDVLVREGDPEIEIGWSDPTRMCREVAMVPKSFQQIKIIHPKHIRG
jgi:hypothetical protein